MSSNTNVQKTTDKDWKAPSRNVEDVLSIKYQYLSIDLNLSYFLITGNK